MRTAYMVAPPKTGCAFAEFGRSFVPVLEALCGWGGAISINWRRQAGVQRKSKVNLT